MVWETLKGNHTIGKGWDQEYVNPYYIMRYESHNIINFYETTRSRTSWGCCRQVVPTPFLLSKSMKISQTYYVFTVLYLLYWRSCSQSWKGRHRAPSPGVLWSLRHHVCVFGHVASCVNICFPLTSNYHGSGDTPSRVRICRYEDHSKVFSRRVVVTSCHFGQLPL